MTEKMVKLPNGSIHPRMIVIFAIQALEQMPRKGFGFCELIRHCQDPQYEISGVSAEYLTRRCFIVDGEVPMFVKDIVASADGELDFFKVLKRLEVVVSEPTA
jgi:hypothetical protein